MRLVFSLFLLLFVSISVDAQNLEGTYEFIIENHSKQHIVLRKDHTSEETEHRWHDGQWRYKCKYIGVWSVVGDTLIIKQKSVVWYDGRVTTCRDQDDMNQPGCCFSSEFFYDEKNIWNFGPISKTKFLYDKISPEAK
jgi:hypothetical protein